MPRPLDSAIALFCYSLVPTAMLMETETDVRPWVWLLAGWGVVALGAGVRQAGAWWRAPRRFGRGE